MIFHTSQISCIYTRHKLPNSNSKLCSQSLNLSKSSSVSNKSLFSQFEHLGHYTKLTGSLHKCTSTCQIGWLSKRNYAWTLDKFSDLIVKVRRMDRDTECDIKIANKDLGRIMTTHQFRVVKANLTHIHGWRLLQIVPWCINNINIIHLITYNQ